MQQHIVVGHNAPGQKDEGMMTDLQKNYQDMLMKIKEQEQKHQEILNEQKTREEDVMAVEKKYVNLQDEVEDTRKVIKKLKKRCKDAQAEIQDLEKEHERSREELFDAIRLLEKDVKTNYAIMTQILGTEELEKLRKKAKWSEEKNEFYVPPFLLRLGGKVKFPKIPFAQAYEMVKADWKNRDIEFLQVEENDEDYNQRQIEEFWADDHAKAKKLLEANKTLLNAKSIKNELPAFQESPQQKLKKNQGIKNYISNEQIPDLPTFQATRIDRSQGLPGKKPSRGFVLEPINQSTNIQTSKNSEDSSFGSKNLPGMISKGQLKPLSNTTRGVKLQFKATVLINNDGNHITNAEIDEF